MNKEAIINYFKSGIKDPNNIKIGVEHEKFLFYKNTNKRIDYSTIKDAFKILYEFGWKPFFEGENVIALNKDGKSITLEPGNQIELAGAQLKNIHEVCSEANYYLFELNQVVEKLNLKIVSAGFDPISNLSEIPNNPKKRYEVMTKDMPKGGSLSLDMMYRTSGTQLNLDYVSENDFTKKFKLANNLVPLSIALFANSSIVEKKDSKYLSYRSKVWQETSRGGLPKIFLENIDFEKYADFVIDYPILFLKKDNKYISGENYKFSDYMSGNIKEINNSLPSFDELGLHLSTIFTENRLKQYIELRSMDTCGWSCICAGPAFFTGLLYGNLDEALDLISKWKQSDVLNAYKIAPKKGLNTNLMGKDMIYWISKLLEIAHKGLKKRDFIGKTGSNEAKYLQHLYNIIDNKETVASHVINKFSKFQNLEDLYDK
tara:strand:- start:257 stop:1546 length:1290 start_codon:yes stop_codon:yes gene_type:complete